MSARQRNLPAWLMALASRPVYNPRSLYGTCKERVKHLYKDNWDEVDCLPITIQRDLLTDWLMCEDVPDDNWAITLLSFNSWQDMLPIPPQIFVALMNHPFEIPRFAHEENHVVKRYVHWSQPNRDVPYKLLCPGCFNHIAKPGREWSGNWWEEMGWVFHAMVNHTVVAGDVLLYEIWATEAWCSRCITGSLLSIYSPYECSEMSEFHMIEGDVEQFNSGRLQGHRVSAQDYLNIPASDKY